MHCKKCGAEIVADAKFCENCGTTVENKPLPNQSKAPTSPSPIEGIIIEHDTVQKKKWGIPEKILFAVTGFELFHAVGMLINREAMIVGTYSYNLSAALESFIIAVVCFVIAMIVHNKRRLTDHYKFKCPYCSEENTIAADETNTFSCSKCKKTMTIIDGQIKTIV